MQLDARRQPVAVFLDFDGTISRADVVDAMLERFADAAWKDVEQEWRDGRIGSRACLARQLALVRASTRQMDELLDAIEIDEGFVPLLEACARARAPVHIVSDGFDYCIRRILTRIPAAGSRLLAAVTVSASHLEPAPDDRWVTAFPFPAEACTHGCATCKPARMRALAAAGAYTVFAGDGLSDRYAAGEASVVFAKTSLRTYCLEQHLAHVAYDTLGDIAACIEHDMRIRA
jgi:2,3-diketo-5-methylthio-1-phosphopentane phosphatase